MNKNYSDNNHCIDCKILIVNWATRCKSCNMKSLRGDRWTRNHDCCIQCGTTEKKHAGGGLCTLCKNYKYRLDHRLEINERVRIRELSGNNHCPGCGAIIDDKSTRCKSCYCKYMNSQKKGISLSEEHKNRIVKSMMKSLNIRPTKPEKEIFRLIKILTQDFRYNGDYSQGTTIGGRIPDFVNCNGKKQVIECFGRYWHDPKFNPKVKDHYTYEQTMKDYKEQGYDCLIIWDYELKDMTNVTDKIKMFIDFDKMISSENVLGGIENGRAQIT